MEYIHFEIHVATDAGCSEWSVPLLLTDIFLACVHIFASWVFAVRLRSLENLTVLYPNTPKDYALAKYYTPNPDQDIDAGGKFTLTWYVVLG